MTAFVARNVDPEFTCAANIGNQTLKIKGGILTSYEMAVYPIETAHIDKTGHLIRSRSSSNMRELTLKSIVPLNGIIYELNKEQRIRNKRVEECTVDELLYAIQKKIKEK